MVFSEFAKKLFSVLSGGDSAEIFTRTIFDALVTEEGRPFVKEKSISSYKSYFYGKNQITKFARSINTHIDRLNFCVFLDGYGDAVSENLRSVFLEDFPDATDENIKEILSDCFVEIVMDAAKAKNKHTEIKTNVDSNLIELGKEYVEQHLNDIIPNEVNNVQPFEKYLKKAKEYYSEIKTLLYAEKPHPFNEMYVCNNIVHHSRRVNGDNRKISNATISAFEPVYTHVIVEGTGGMGKSMFLTHLLLSFDKNMDASSRTPILVQLRDFADPKMTLLELVLYSVRKFEFSITEDNVIDAIKCGKLILLLDGLDEVPSSCRNRFNEELENYVKSYMKNTVIMTSRPISSFVSYTQFALFDIQELTKEQAIRLVEKLEFWDNESKERFLIALDERLFKTHHEFACNPLLLTIMLMTYSSFGDVPAKMHLFYSEAYRTMSRLHDASKGSYIRQLNTGITPEEFSDLFAEFCARTYVKECVEFDERTFTEYLKQVLSKTKPIYRNIKVHDFLLDLTDNLCIMYQEGEKFYFLHRSFQEYFAALYFSTNYDDKLVKLGKFFENKRIRFSSDIAFDMLFDMIPDKIERYVFLPYLEDLFSDDTNESVEEYWNVLRNIYPCINYYDGETGESYLTIPESFLYEKILSLKNMKLWFATLDDYQWPDQIADWPTTKNWCNAYSKFLDWKDFNNYSSADEIPIDLLVNKSNVNIEDVPEEYFEFFGAPELSGISSEIDIEELMNNRDQFPDIVSAIESSSFPLMKEYQLIKEYYKDLKVKIQRIADSDSLFDD